MRTFVIGDIHGNYKGLLQVLERSGFDMEQDMLITLGDIVDGCPDSYQCVEKLMEIPNRIDIRGNHDKWFYDWMDGKGHEPKWAQGGLATVKSYAKAHSRPLHAHKSYERDMFDRPRPVYRVNFFPYQITVNHKEFFHKQAKFYVDDKNRAFVHAGYTHPKGLGHEDPYIYMWTRELWEKHAMIPSQSIPKLLKPYDKIFIGHTQTIDWDETKPMLRYNTWNLDTGAGHPKGKLTIMNVDTEEYWQSDLTTDLYPDYTYDR